MQQVVVRTIDQYWKDFIVEGISKKEHKEVTKKKLIEAFQTEMEGLIVMRTGCDNLNVIPKTPENKRRIDNVFKQAMHKWQMLCGRCNKYYETKGMIKVSDLTLDMRDENKEKTDA